MSSTSSDLVPVEIKLHQKSRMLEVVFDDGAHFQLPCEYLRVFSPSAEVKAMTNRGDIVKGKQNVNITTITPIGHYAVQLTFDDGHDTGVYSWETLYELGKNQQNNWSSYQKKLAGVKSPEVSGPIRVRILYFVNLPGELGLESEHTDVPDSVKTVKELIDWIKGRGEKWNKALSKHPLKITINKQFVDPEAIIRNNDEIALVPAPPSVAG
ncbi:MAG: gamma-butyrobetaine hydroxylase-like domain-containing protein [Gammaproteobacteria bacterium]|nr:gamma-butyrobetaine hydroxylase-like domain-containing protein [Gammaproteobacteria bacterium]